MQCQMCRGTSTIGCQYCNPGRFETIPVIHSTPAIKGWECPKCEQVFSPFINKCDKCGVPEK